MVCLSESRRGVNFRGVICARRYCNILEFIYKQICQPCYQSGGNILDVSDTTKSFQEKTKFTLNAAKMFYLRRLYRVNLGLFPSMRSSIFIVNYYYFRHFKGNSERGQSNSEYPRLLKTGSLDNAIREFSLAQPLWAMSHYTCDFLRRFYFFKVEFALFLGRFK